MKKIIISLMVLLLFVVGCGSNEDKIEEEVIESTEEVTSNDDKELVKETAAEVATEPESEVTEAIEEATEEAAEEAVESEEETAEGTNVDEDELQDYIDVELTDIDGNIVRISDYDGKFIILNFFGVWCHYCMEEMPDLEKVYSEYVGDDFVILLVNATTTEKIGKDGVIEWYKNGLDIDGETVPITMPMAMDLDGSALEVYPVSGFPTSYFINKRGKVIGAVPGMLDEATILSILDQYNN